MSVVITEDHSDFNPMRVRLKTRERGCHSPARIFFIMKRCCINRCLVIVLCASAECWVRDWTIWDLYVAFLKQGLLLDLLWNHSRSYSPSLCVLLLQASTHQPSLPLRGVRRGFQTPQGAGPPLSYPPRSAWAIPHLALCPFGVPLPVLHTKWTLAKYQMQIKIGVGKSVKQLVSSWLVIGSTE